MKMLVLIFRDFLQEEILSLLTNKKIPAYAMIPKMHGMGKTETAFGSFTSQGESSSVLLTVACESDDRGVSGASIPTPQYQQEAAIPMKLMVMPCEEVI